MAKSRRKQSIGGRWPNKEKDQLWKLRHENPEMSWETFRHEFFPLRSACALANAYSVSLIERLDHSMLTLDKAMKLAQDRRASQDDEPVTTRRRASQDDEPVTTRRRASQDNKRKFSDEGTTTAEQRAKKQQTSSTDSLEEMSSTSDDDESDNYTDSEAGDIPYEDGLPRRLFRNPIPRRSIRNRRTTVLKVPALKHKGKAAASPATEPANTQSPPVDSTTTMSSAPMTVHDRRSAVNPSPAPGPSTAGQQYSTTRLTEQPALNVAPEPSGESYASMSRAFQYAANVFMQYPHVKSRAEKAEQESNIKESYIKEIQSLHKAEVLNLQDRVTVQNKIIREQRATIEGFQMQPKLSESKNVGKQQEQDGTKNLSMELKESKEAFQALKQKFEELNQQHGGKIECDRCSALYQENLGLREELISARRLLRMTVGSRLPRGQLPAAETEPNQAVPVSCFSLV